MRRYDLIPNLVETCKGYMAHERETLDAVIKARNQAAGAAQTASANPGNAAAMRGLQQADGALTGVLGRMFALAEAYPDLKANQNMLGLQEELTSSKTRFRLHARATTIRSWNTTPSAHPVPDNIFAGMYGFNAAELLQAIKSAEERKAVQVKF